MANPILSSTVVASTPSTSIPHFQRNLRRLWWPEMPAYTLGVLLLTGCSPSRRVPVAPTTVAAPAPFAEQAGLGTGGTKPGGPSTLDGGFACHWTGENLQPAGTYHVSVQGADSNTGRSREQAFQTLQRAAKAVGPGDTVLVYDGTYGRDGEPALLLTTSGTERAPITFRAAPDAHPVLESHAWHTLQVADASYIVIDGFEVVGRSRTIDLAFARAHQLDRDNDVTNGDGIHVWNYETGGHSHHVIVRNNRVHHFGGAGIFAAEADCLTISDNIVYSNSWYTVLGSSGVAIWRPRNLVDGPGYKTVIRNNRSFDNENMIPWVDASKDPEPMVGGNGIILDDPLDLKYTGPILVEGNLAYRNGGCGLQAFKGHRSDFINNVSYRNLRNSKTEWGELCVYESVSTRFLRNVAEASPGHAITFVRRSPDTQFDYNLYWPAQGAIAQRGEHDRIVDPQFMDVSGNDTPGSFSETGFDFRRR